MNHEARVLPGTSNGKAAPEFYFASAHDFPRLAEDVCCGRRRTSESGHWMMDNEKVNILLVDDQPAKLLAYEVILKELGENLIVAESGREALEFLLKNEVAVILVDVCMPELDGFELAAMIREHPRFQKTAMIFISAIQVRDPEPSRGSASGGVAYVPVPVIPQVLRAKIKVFA